MKLEHGEKEEIGRSIVRRLVRSFFLRSQSTSDEGRVRVARSGAFQRRRSFVRSLAPPPMSRFQDQNLNEVLVRSRGSTRRTPSLPYLTRGGEILVDLLLFAALSLSLSLSSSSTLSRGCFRPSARCVTREDTDRGFATRHLYILSYLQV